MNNVYSHFEQSMHFLDLTAHETVIHQIIDILAFLKIIIRSPKIHTASHTMKHAISKIFKI